MCSPEGLRHLADAVQEQKDSMVKDFTMERDLLAFIPSKGDCLLLSSAVPMDDYVTGGRRGVAFDRIVNYDGSHLCLHGEGFVVGFDNLKDYDKDRVYVKAKLGQDVNIRLLLPRVRNAVVERTMDTSPRAVFDSDSAVLVKSYLDLFHKDSHGEVISSLFSDLSFDTRLKSIPHRWIDDVRQECMDLLLGKERQQSSALRI